MPDEITPAERAAIAAYRGRVYRAKPFESAEAEGAHGEYRTAARRRFLKRRKFSAVARKMRARNA